MRLSQVGFSRLSSPTKAPGWRLSSWRRWQLGFLYNAGLSIYHAGAEWHFWPGPDTCTGDGDLLQPKSLSKALQHNQVVRCDEAAIRIFGMSLAGYNVLISGALAAFGGFAAVRQAAQPLAPKRWPGQARPQWIVF